MDELGKHFIINLLDRLREEAHPDGCPDCQDLEGDMRCFGCADTLATVDAIERLLIEVSELREWQKTNRNAIARASNAETEVERIRQKCAHRDITLRCDLDEYECLDCGGILYDGPTADPGQNDGT